MKPPSDRSTSRAVASPRGRLVFERLATRSVARGAQHPRADRTPHRRRARGERVSRARRTSRPARAASSRRRRRHRRRGSVTVAARRSRPISGATLDCGRSRWRVRSRAVAARDTSAPAGDGRRLGVAVNRAVPCAGTPWLRTPPPRAPRRREAHEHRGHAQPVRVTSAKSTRDADGRTRARERPPPRCALPLPRRRAAPPPPFAPTPDASFVPWSPPSRRRQILKRRRRSSPADVSKMEGASPFSTAAARKNFGSPSRTAASPSPWTPRSSPCASSRQGRERRHERLRLAPPRTPVPRGRRGGQP